MRSAVAVLLVVTSSCAAIPTPGAKAQEAARDYNEQARFGRMELAVESVAPAYRDEFGRVHRSWGGLVHIQDSEMAGMKLKSDHEAEVVVRFAWSRDDRTDLFETSVRQYWTASLAGWKLSREERVDGAPGLLGEQVVVMEPSMPQTRASRFPTVQIPTTE